MPDKDTINLPILDDIIVPGDADKAVFETSSKVQSAYWQDDDRDTTDFSSANTHAVIDTPAAEDDQALAAALLIEDLLDTDADDQMDVSSSAEIHEEIRPDKPAQADSLAAHRSIHQAPVNLQNIEALTEEILGNIMPDLEQLLREKIQQVLQKRISSKIGAD